MRPPSRDANGIVPGGFADEGFSAGLQVNYCGNVASCQAEELGLNPTATG